MKRLLFLVTCLGIICLAGCKMADDNHQKMMDANSKVMKAIETGDKATIENHIAADAIDHGGNPDGSDMTGTEVINMLSNVHNDIDNLKMEIIQQAANDDHVFSLVRMTGTTNKPVWGMPSNFKMDMKSIDMLKMKDGKMVEHWSFMEPAEMMKMMPPPPPPQGGMPMDGGMRPDSMMH